MSNRVYKKHARRKNISARAVCGIVIVAVAAIIMIVWPKTVGNNTAGTPSNTDNSSSLVQQPVEISYEERVGVDYKIDIEQYIEFIEPQDKYEYVFLVNPDNKLASDYVPEDLTDCGHTRNDGRAVQKLRRNAAEALKAFLAEGKMCGVTDVTVTSAYRSYEYQDYLFNLYCSQHQHKFSTREECEKYVLTFSTKPGTSEHQSGLCVDMHNIPSAEAYFAEKPEAKWLAENCYRFGFILRYPEDKTHITGITYEPWHFRFVGREAATEMYEKGLCMEEYIKQQSGIN